MAHPDLDTLLNLVLPFAQQQMKRRGGFHPFGATLGADGQFAMVMSESAGDQATAERQVAVLEAGIRQGAGEGTVRASAICLDVRIQLEGQSGKSDAISARLEHAEGEAIQVFLPYRKGLLGRLTYGEIIGEPGETRLFPR